MQWRRRSESSLKIIEKFDSGNFTFDKGLVQPGRNKGLVQPGRNRPSQRLNLNFQITVSHVFFSALPM